MAFFRDISEKRMGSTELEITNVQNGNSSFDSKVINTASGNALTETNSTERGREIDVNEDEANANDSIRRRFEPNLNSIHSSCSHEEKQCSSIMRTDFGTWTDRTPEP
jgi:hypothetical protein